MNETQWQRVKTLFHDALACEPEQRDAFVARVSAGDPEVQREVNRLLAAHAQADRFIEQPSVSGSARPGSSPATASGRCLTPGQIRGHYEILRLIGVGGMGEVYTAKDLQLGRTVALKVVTGDEEESQRALRREARHASQLNHPHICTIHEVSTSDGQSFIVMEYVEGTLLSDLIAPPRPPGTHAQDSTAGPHMPLTTVLRYGIQIADGLAYAHSQGIIHRDLKGANIVITPDGRAKILDFGLARRLPSDRLKDLSASPASATAFGMVSGTLAYMAPELLRGEKADARSDIWALGVLLYEMATGARPFTGVTSFDETARILHDPPALLPASVAPPLQRIIQRCLAKDPRERYAQAAEVRAALEAVQPDIPGAVVGAPVAAAEPLHRRFLKSCTSRRIAWITACTLLVVGALFARGAYRRYAITHAAPVAVGASGRPAIAVMNFTNTGEGTDRKTDWLSSGVPSMLLTGLAQTRGLDIVGPDRLSDAARQMGVGKPEELDKSEGAAVARRAGAGAIVVGNIFRAGNEFRIDAQLEDLSTGHVLAADSVRGTDVFALVDQLSSKIREGVGLHDANGIRSVAEISSSSLEAQRLYAIGSEAVTNLRLEEGREALEKAVAIDPNFADAYMRLAFVYASTGKTAARKAMSRKALAHLDRLSDRDRSRIRLVSGIEDGRFAEAESALNELLIKYPDSDVAYTLARLLYAPVTGPLENPDKLLAIVQQGVKAVPASTYVRNEYGYVLLLRGRYEDAVREFETYAKQAPREPNPYDSLGEAYLLMGRPDKAIENYSRALTIDPTFGTSHNGRSWSFATLGRYDEALAENPPAAHIRALILSRVGRYRDAEAVIKAAIRSAQENENADAVGELSLLSAALALERHNTDDALKLTDAAVKAVDTVPMPQKRGFLVAVDLFKGAAELQRGQIDAARAHLASQERVYHSGSDPEKWWHAALEGEIDLATHDLDHAAAAFNAGAPARRFFSFYASLLSSASISILFRDGPARVAVARGDLQGAIAIYRRLLIYGPEEKWVAAYEPRYVLEIARLLDRTGRKQAARFEYERFLDLWKSADPELPELAEARRAVGVTPN